MQTALKIYYADDDADDRYLFEIALEQLDIPYELAAFDNGLSLEQGLKNNNYKCDLVFLDLNMPGRNGLQTLSSLQQAIKDNHLKVVVFTTSADPGIMQQTFDLNAVLFVQKPNDFSNLVQTLRTIINKIKHYRLPVPFSDFKYSPDYG